MMRVVVFLSLLAVLAFVGYVAIGGYFLANTAAAILRVGPLSVALSEVAPPTDPMAPGYSGTPTEALGLPFQTVSIDTPLGPAEAWLVPAAGPETGRAIFVHGIAGQRGEGYRHLETLHAAGWSVLMISYRNDPGAPGDPSGLYGFGLLEWPDLEAAVRYFSPGPGGPPLMVAADSMGGAILGQFLARSALADRVGSVALDSPALSFSAVVDHLAAEGGRPLSGLIAWTARLILPQLIDLPLAEAEVAATFTAFPGPLFIAQGSGDRLIPIGPAQAMAAAREARTVTLWTGADHLRSYGENPAAYREAFAGFVAGLPR